MSVSMCTWSPTTCMCPYVSVHMNECTGALPSVHCSPCAALPMREDKRRADKEDERSGRLISMPMPLCWQGHRNSSLTASFLGSAVMDTISCSTASYHPHGNGSRCTCHGRRYTSMGVRVCEFGPGCAYVCLNLGVRMCVCVCVCVKRLERGERSFCHFSYQRLGLDGVKGP